MSEAARQVVGAELEGVLCTVGCNVKRAGLVCQVRWRPVKQAHMHKADRSGLAGAAGDPVALRVYDVVIYGAGEHTVVPMWI